MSKIEWTGLTWNPIVGCSLASTGCARCYAISEAWRKMFHPNATVAEKFAGTVEKSKAGQLLWTGRINFSEAALLAPLRRKKPTTWFVNSLSDLFHENVSDEQIDRIFAVMALCPQHRFQVLTKRADRMRDYLNGSARGRCLAVHDLNDSSSCAARLRLATEAGDPLPLPNVWLGVSVENQDAAEVRIPALLATPAAVRFLSCEPLVGHLDLGSIRGEPVLNPECWGDCSCDDFVGFDPGCRRNGGDGTLTRKIDWVICGGESGPEARPLYPEWAQSLRDQCAEADVPFFFKQWGNWLPCDECPPKARGWRIADGEGFANVGKRTAGRLLDGVTHDAMPRAPQ